MIEELDDNNTYLKYKFTTEVSKKLHESKIGIINFNKDSLKLKDDIWLNYFNNKSFPNREEGIKSPIVNAGIDQSVEIGTEAKFVASVSMGNSPIDYILWEQISGVQADLSNANTLELTVNNFSFGESIFKVTIIDQYELSSSDTVVLNGISDSVTVYYGHKPNNALLTYNQIILGDSIVIPFNDDVLIPFDYNTPEYMWIAIPSSQSTKYFYEDVVDAFNSGTIGNPGDLFAAPQFISGITNYNLYISQYPTYYQESNLIKGIKLKETE